MYAPFEVGVDYKSEPGKDDEIIAKYDSKCIFSVLVKDNQELTEKEFIKKWGMRYEAAYRWEEDKETTRIANMGNFNVRHVINARGEVRQIDEIEFAEYPFGFALEAFQDDASALYDEFCGLVKSRECMEHEEMKWTQKLQKKWTSLNFDEEDVRFSVFVEMNSQGCFLTLTAMNGTTLRISAKDVARGNFSW